MPQKTAYALAARRRRADTAATRRARRLTGLVLLAAVAFVTLLLTAFGSGRSGAVRPVAPAPATRLLPAGPPSPQVIALSGALQLQLPVAQSRLNAIGYHATGDDALALQPLGRQGNEGTLTHLVHRVFGGSSTGLRYFQLDGGSGVGTAAVDIGAAADTDVYSPVDGTVVGITSTIVNGRRFGVRIDVQPTAAPSLLVSLTHLTPDRNLTVGSTVASGVSKVGSIVDFSPVEKQALARYTQDAGNHVEISVHAALTTP